MKCLIPNIIRGIWCKDQGGVTSNLAKDSKGVRLEMITKIIPMLQYLRVVECEDHHYNSLLIEISCRKRMFVILSEEIHYWGECLKFVCYCFCSTLSKREDHRGSTFEGENVRRSFSTNDYLKISSWRLFLKKT